MPVPLLDLRAQYATIHKEVVAAVMRVVEDQAFILGPPVAQLEDEVAELSGTRYAIGCASDCRRRKREQEPDGVFSS